MKYVAKKRITYTDIDDQIVTVQKDQVIEPYPTSITKSLLQSKLIEVVVEEDELPDVVDSMVILSEEEIRKMKSKTAILKYANQIGFDEIDKSQTLEQLKDAVIDFIEQMHRYDNENESVVDTNEL